VTAAFVQRFVPRLARDIQQTNQPLSLTVEQNDKLRGLFAGRDVPRADPGNFAVAIGVAVPKQVPLKPLPSGASDLLQGCQGDMYTMVGDQLVIVDAQAGRVVAIVPNIT
jgi:hypothetical protein